MNDDAYLNTLGIKCFFDTDDEGQDFVIVYRNGVVTITDWDSVIDCLDSLDGHAPPLRPGTALNDIFIAADNDRN